MTDKNTIRLSSATVLAALLLALFLPIGESGRIVAAVLLIPAAVLIPMLIKKRNILSIHKNQVLLIVTVIALLYVMVYYLTGLHFGFYKNPYKLSFNVFLKYILPISAIIAATEIIRGVLMAQTGRLARALCYLSCVAADVLIVSNVPSVTSFNRFMDMVAGALLPALIFNLLFNYLSKRYGIYPCLLYRLITTLYLYIFPVTSGISDSILNFFRILLPIAIYLFIDALYEKKRRFALRRVSRVWSAVSVVVSVLAIIIMIGTVMLVSNQFKYGSLVIATESMTGEINKGDVIFFERYDDHEIIEGQVIVFEKYNVMVVHRVVDIEIINGVARYYTKGDANEDWDAGYILDSEIVGLVNYKLPVVGYPTIWMRSLFKH
jgi:signal peptidase